MPIHNTMLCLQETKQAQGRTLKQGTRQMQYVQVRSSRSSRLPLR